MSNTCTCVGWQIGDSVSKENIRTLCNKYLTPILMEADDGEFVEALEDVQGKIDAAEKSDKDYLKIIAATVKEFNDDELGPLEEKVKGYFGVYYFPTYDNKKMDKMEKIMRGSVLQKAIKEVLGDAVASTLGQKADLAC